MTKSPRKICKHNFTLGILEFSGLPMTIWQKFFWVCWFWTGIEKNCEISVWWRLLKWFDKFFELTVIASDTSTKTSDPSAWCKIRYGVGFDSLTESIVPTNIEVNPLPLLPLRRCMIKCRLARSVTQRGPDTRTSFGCTNILSKVSN